MYNVIIAGSRTITTFNILVKAFNNSQFLQMDKNNLNIISGGAYGADKLGEIFSRKYLHKEPTIIHAQWNMYGKKAGVLRNIKMVDMSQGALFLWDGESPGTKQCIRYAKERGLDIHIEIIK